jgi:hypothetical protein
MPKRNYVWPNFKLPANLARNEEFLINLKSEVISQASDDSPSSGDLAAIIGKYNSATEDGREAMNDAFVWMTGYSLPSLAAAAYLENEPVERRDDEAIHVLMRLWADAARWKGAV